MAVRFSLTRALLTLAAACGLAVVRPANCQAASDIEVLSFTSLRDTLRDPSIVPVSYADPATGNPCCPCPCPGGVSSTSPTPNADGTLPSQNYSPSFEGDQFASLGGSGMNINTAPGGYIDNPIVGTWFRLRYDNANDNTRPDRAEFLYAKYGLIGGPGPNTPTGNSPNRVDYQILSPYFELLLAPRLSGFVELNIAKVDINFPNVANDPSQGNTVISNGGFGDMNAGIKYAIVANDDAYLTFQFKTYMPTGDAARGLGTHHVSLEPGLLYLRRLGGRTYFQGELRQWVPVGGTDFSGNITRYGAGLGYDILTTYTGASPLNPYVAQGLRVTAVSEFVGWTISGGAYTLPGQAGAANLVTSANGDTIVNLKLGLRGTYGARSLYVGWGHALTGAPWYEDLFRLEYRRMF